MTENQKVAALLITGVLFGLAMKYIANLWFHLAWVIAMFVTLALLWKSKKNKDEN